MTKFGSARISEFNTVNGFRGDQTGAECMEQQAYWHPNGWIGLRATNPNVANAIAWVMKVACMSDIVGYSQNDRYIIFFTGIQNGVPTNADCSSLVAFCVWQAGIQNFEVDGFYTGNEVERLLNTGAFDKFTVNSLEELQTGDILVDAKLTSHTIVVTEGIRRDDVGNVFDVAEPTLEYGDKGAEVRKLQAFFEEYGSGCIVDGDFKGQTKQLVSDFQTIWGLRRDGIYGWQTHDAVCFYLYAKGIHTI